MDEEKLVKNFTNGLRRGVAAASLNVNIREKVRKMKKYMFLALMGSLVTGMAGVKGKIVLEGEAPAPRRPIAEADALCGAALGKKKLNLFTRTWVVGEGNGLGDVVVFVSKGLEGKDLTPSSEMPVLDQLNCEYVPYVMAVQAGQPFKVQNSDTLFHNVRTTPKEKGNAGFNIAQVTKGMMTKTHTFPTPEMFVRFQCDVHRWMFAYVTVVDTAAYAVTDENGNFKLPVDLPAGKYTLTAVHRKIVDGAKPKLHTQEFEVVDGKETEVNFQVSAK